MHTERDMEKLRRGNAERDQEEAGRKEEKSETQTRWSESCVSTNRLQQTREHNGVEKWD